MSSSEEYLDNLLNALLGNENNMGEEQAVKPDSPEEPFVSIGDMPEEESSGEGGASETPPIKSSAKESNKAMSTDEIEEMLASMGGGIVTRASEVSELQGFNEAESEEEPVENDEAVQQADVPATTGKFVPEDLILDEMLLPKESEATEADSWTLEEELLPEMTGTEEISGPDSWALEEELLPEEPETKEASGPDSWALEEELLPEGSGMEESSEPDSWALEEERLPEEEEAFEPDSWALEEELQPEGAEIEEISEPDSWALEEELLPERPEIEEVSEPDNWVLEGDILSKESEQNERTEPDSWNLEDNPVPEKPEAEEMFALDETPHETEASSELEEWDLKEDVLTENTGDDWDLEENPLSEQVIEEIATEEGNILSGIGTEEEELAMMPDAGADTSEDAELTDLEADSPDADSFGMEADSPDADSFGMEADSPDADSFGMDADSLGADSFGMEADSPDADSFGMDADSLGADSFGMEADSPDADSFGMETDSLGADSFGMDAEPPAGNTMSEEEVDRLLGDDFGLEESGEADEGLSELLESMGHDEDLSEINDLLEKADRGLMEDDDMMALLGNPLADETEENNDVFDFWGQDDVADIPSQKSQEIMPTDNEEGVSDKKEKRKKKDKKAGKKNKKSESEQGDTGEEKVKKKGVMARFLESLLEDEEELSDNADDGGELGSLSAENAELLAELNAEDKKNAAKKDKKKKAAKKKEKKEKKPKKAPKPKKPKKEKKASAQENKVPEKKISRTKIVFVFLFCASVAACIIVVDMFIPDYMQKQEAQEMFEDGRYEETYGLLYGKELNEEEAAMLQKSNIILQVRRKLQSYETYNKLDMQSEALNALVEGVERYQMFRMDAEQYGVTSEIDDIYTRILSALSENYGVSEADALDILASESDLIYSEKIYGIINGTGMESTEEQQDIEQEIEQDIKQDVLPEEEEIIDRLDNPEVSE